MTNEHSKVRRFATAAAIAVVTAWLVGRLASDRFIWSQFLLWIPTPLAIAAAITGVVLARRTWDRFAWSAAIVALTLDFATIEHRLLGGPDPQPGAVSIVGGNVHLAGPRRVAEFAAAFRDLEGDISIASTVLPPADVYQLTDQMTGLGTTVVVWPFVFVSRLPIIEARPMVVTEDIHAAILRVDATAELGGVLTIWSVDLPSNPFRSRGAIAEQTRFLLHSVEATPPDLVIGDFNMTRGASLRSIFPDHEHAWDQAGRGYGASFTRRLPLYHIDHILLGPTFRATSYELVDPGVGRHDYQVVQIAPH